MRRIRFAKIDVWHEIRLFYWIYNLIRAVFFSKFERLFKKNMYCPSKAMTFSHVSSSLLCSDVNRIPVRAFCIKQINCVR